MGEASLWGGPLKSEMFGFVASVTRGTGVAAHASSHTKGSYVQLIASTGFAYEELTLVLGPTSADAYRQFLVDIAVGAAAAEVNLVSNLMLSGIAIGGQISRLDVPLRVPAGSRIAARCQCSVGSTSIYVAGYGTSRGRGSVPALGRCATYGADTANSRGITVDPGGSANTKGSWVEITASTANRIRLLYLNLGHHLVGTLIGSDTNYSFDVGVGGAGSEVIVVPDIQARRGTGGGGYHYTEQLFGPWEVDIPAGSRLAVRAQASTTGTNDRQSDVTLLGVD